MFTVNVICVGNLKDKYWKDACDEYEKRLSRWCNIRFLEIDEKKLSGNPNEAQINAALDNEADRILQNITSSAYVNSLCIEGRQLSSPDFASEISQLMVNGCSSVYFIIGSSNGLSQRVKDRANVKLSLSQMTFPHRLARVMLMEQIYRAFCIINSVKYHK
jgi:23S rRNA (pseudouridine1915-N3)-methyltransferase